MDPKVFCQAFALIFFAEIGDKTQLATLTLAAQTGSRWSVFAGSSLALVCTSALGCLGGALLAKWISPIWMHRIAGTAFIVIGVLTVWNAGSD